MVSLSLGPYLEVEYMNQKAKPHKPSLVVVEQNYIRVLGLCFFVSEEFEYNDQMLIALYYDIRVFCFFQYSF